MYTTNEILFPTYAIADLRNVRGTQWRELVDRLLTLQETDEEVLAFMLMMIRLNGCMECETDSYRAMRGCCACAQQTLRRSKASETELLAQYQTALTDIRSYVINQVPVTA
jgi:hypothetical protein